MKILFIALVAIITLPVIALEETEGMRAMRLGCEKQKLGLGCTNYANFLIRNGRESEAEEYFKKACGLGNQDGCDKKRWPVMEVVPPAPEVVVEPPIEEAPQDTSMETPESTEAPEIASPSEEISPTDEPISPANDEEPVPTPAE